MGPYELASIRSDASHGRRYDAPVESLGTLASPTSVRYIKLGEGGRYERACIDEGTIRLGFGTADPERYALSVAGRWDEVLANLEAERGRGSSATRARNEIRAFFEDDGSTLWLTVLGERLYWAFLDSGPPQRRSDRDGTWRKVRGAWSDADITGEPLTKDRLSGALTKLASFRGTSCRVRGSDATYAVRRIQGQKTPEVERAISAVSELTEATVGLMRLLGPRDFELLVDLVFSSSGWRRLGVVGKTQKTLDLDLWLPSTGERAFVQVKSATTQAELDDYVKRLGDAGPYDRMFFVYHSGRAATADGRVTIVGPERLSAMVLDAGLVDWLIHKTS